MPLLDAITKKVTNQLPSVISPKGHAIADYATAAAFLGFGAWAWNRNRRAALGSVLCGVFELGMSAVTDYSGRRSKQLSFLSHGRIDVGLAAMVGTMPEYLGIKDAREARFFQLQAVTLAAITGLTDFMGTGRGGQLGHLDKAA